AGIHALLTDAEGRALLGTPREGAVRTVSRKAAGTPFTVVASVIGDVGEDQMRRAMFEALVICALLLAAIFTVNALLVRRAFSPLAHGARVGAEVAGGNYQARIPLGGYVELDAVANAFNSMAGAMAAGKARLEEAVAERTRAIEAANVEMTSRNRELAE